MARRRANSPVRSRRRRHEESSDSDGYFQAPLVVKPLASPLRESAAPYNSPDTKEYKHASKAKSRSRSSSEASSSGSDDESDDESGTSSSSESQSGSESASDESSSDSSSKSGSQSSDGEREPERPTNGKSKNARNSPKSTVKRKSDRKRSESPSQKKPKESSKRNDSPERRRKASPVQRAAPSPQRRKSPRRDRQKSPRRESERRRSAERRRSPRRDKSPRRRSPRREPQNRRRDSPKSRRTSPRDQRSRNDRKDRRSPRGRENEMRRPNESRRDGDSRRENDSKRDRVRVKTERLSPDAGRDRGTREQRSPELSKWADDQDRRLDNRRPRGPERPKNKQDRLGEMKRRNEEMEAAERKCVWGKQEVKKEEEIKPEDKQKPDLGLSGKLAEDTNVFNGVVVKYNEPSEAKKPKRRWRLYVFKGDDVLPFIPLHRQSAYLLGRDRRVADIPVDHPSCSKQHAVLQYRSVPYQRADGSKGRRVRPYVLDLESANGTFVNNKRIEGSRYVELFERDVLKFGFSSREYVLIPEDAAEMNDEANNRATAPENGEN